MRRVLYVLLVLCLLEGSGTHAGLPLGTSVSTGSGPAETTLTRLDDGGDTTLVFKVKNEALPLHDQGQALDHLLDQTMKQRPLPDHFAVRLGGTRSALIKELQQKLSQPGANWDLANGKPRKGELTSVVSNELSVLLVQSPIGTAFAHHGYRLRVEGIEHIEEEPKEFPQAGAHVPTDILVMEITAERSQQQ